VVADIGTYRRVKPKKTFLLLPLPKKLAVAVVPISSCISQKILLQFQPISVNPNDIPYSYVQQIACGGKIYFVVECRHSPRHRGMAVVGTPPPFRERNNTAPCVPIPSRNIAISIAGNRFLPHCVTVGIVSFGAFSLLLDKKTALGVQF
jgi:hypothetical protein